MEIRPGKQYPLGARYDGAGINFSVFSEVADCVELCLFDETGRETRHRLPEVTAHCWHGYVPNLIPGQSYGFRIHGPWEPSAGSICNPNKLLLDPYAKAISGEVAWNDAVFAFNPGTDELNEIDSAPFVPKSVVTNPFFDWTDDHSPRVPWNETVI
ncbi:MAG: glycogen debranching enzyme, partial [Spirochaetaceae bacterium]